MRNILYIGGSGGVGSELFKTNRLHDPDHKHISLGSSDCDVTDLGSIDNAFEKYNPDIIVYLSAFNSDGLVHKQLWNNVDHQIKVNIEGLVNVMRSCTPYMREKEYGRFIYISSVLSIKPMIGTGIYSASKAFGDNLIKTYALENAKYNITANSIQLGYFNKGLTERVPEKILENVIAKIPSKRLGYVWELEPVINLLINNRYISGANIPLTSGLENV